MTVLLVTLFLLPLALANPDDLTQIEKYGEKVKTYRLEVTGKRPITIIETEPNRQDARWEDISTQHSGRDDFEVKNLMTHIIHDVGTNKPRCYGPSCQDGFKPEVGPQKDFYDYSLDLDKGKDYRDLSKDRLEAITALAAKLKKDKLLADRYSLNSEQSEEDDNGKVFTSWNRMKVKQHKHPYDDKDGWVSLEPVAWSTSKVSKWKPNVKKQKPNHWNDDDDRYPSDDGYNTYNSFQDTEDTGSSYSYQQKKPVISRPGYINNKLHAPLDYDTEIPSRPGWAKPQQSTFSTWSPDEGRKPLKPHCDSHESYPGDDTVFYGISDSVVTDHRPSNFPYEYQALHQAALHRPLRRPTEVVYAGSPDLDSDRSSKPPRGDGQWVLLSTTKGYRNKKRQRSLNPDPDDQVNQSVTSHQAVALTVLPMDNTHNNMTTSHGGLLEVEKSFQTVEESKRDMDMKHDLEMSSSNNRPERNKVYKRRIVSNMTPDSSTLFAAVGAGMLPATMAMVMPMVLGRRRRRDISDLPTENVHLDHLYLYHQ